MKSRRVFFVAHVFFSVASLVLLLIVLELCKVGPEPIVVMGPL